MSETSSLGRDAVDLANRMNKMLAGESTAVVYMAFAIILAGMERRASRPDRAALFAAIGGLMDDQNRSQSN